MNYSHHVALLTRNFPQSSRRSFFLSFFFSFYGLDAKLDGYAAKVNARNLRSFPPFVGCRATTEWIIPSAVQSGGSPFRDVTPIWAFSLYVLLGTFPKAFHTSFFSEGTDSNVWAAPSRALQQTLNKVKKKTQVSFFFVFWCGCWIKMSTLINRTKRKTNSQKNLELFSLFITWT